jgi:hypothetical protein
MNDNNMTEAHVRVLCVRKGAAFASFLLPIARFSVNQLHEDTHRMQRMPALSSEAYLPRYLNLD